MASRKTQAQIAVTRNDSHSSCRGRPRRHDATQSLGREAPFEGNRCKLVIRVGGWHKRGSL